MNDPEDALRKHVDEQAHSAKVDYLDQWKDDLDALQNGEESRAELLLAGYFLTVNDGYQRVVFHDAWDAHEDPDWGTIMGHSIAINGHMAHFLFRACYRNHRRHLAITLDTEDTRQRSPEAIARDRGLMDAECRVLNFTSSEVLKSAPEITEKISSVLTELLDEMLAIDGHARGPRPTNVSPIRRK